MRRSPYHLILLVQFLLLFFILTSCRKDEPTPTPVPEIEVEPTAPALASVAPTVVELTPVRTTSVPEADEPGPATSELEYQNVPWLWIALSDPEVGPQDIPEPERYQIVLNSDGSTNVQADCNMVSGTYTAEEGNITIELGPSTLAACPDDSLADQFVQNLTAARIMFFEDGDMLFDLVFDSGTMRFSD